MSDLPNSAECQTLFCISYPIISLSDCLNHRHGCIYAQGEINQLEEKVRLFEQYNPRGGREDAAVAGLRAELQVCLQDKEALAAELSSTRLKMEAEQRAHKGELGKLQVS